MNNWNYIKDGRYPDVDKGDGNFVRVWVVTEGDFEAFNTFGTSGAMGEPLHFSDIFENTVGARIKSNDKIVKWKYPEPSAIQYGAIKGS